MTLLFSAEQNFDRKILHEYYNVCVGMDNKQGFMEVIKMRLDGLGLFVDHMPTMVRFYRDVLGFEIIEGEHAVNVYLIKDGTLFMLYERKNFEKMTSRKYEYLKGLNGHFEIALYVDTFEEVDKEYARIIAQGGQSVLEPTTEPWGQRTCYIADPEGNLIEIGSFNRSFDNRTNFNEIQ